MIQIIFKIIMWLLKHLFGFLFGWIPDIDEKMSGEDFEEYVKEILKRNGYKNVNLTKRSGDYGVDILAEYKDVSYAIQCKFYSKPVGVAAIQQAYSGAVYYECDEAVVVTNHRFTSQAQTLAHTNDVMLWDGEVLNRMKRKANSRSLLKRHKEKDVENKEHPYTKVIQLIYDEGYASCLLLEEYFHYSHEKAYYILEDLH